LKIEKAHRDVSNILLQLLDEGSLTDSQGRKVDFKNTIICLTSNLGSDILQSSKYIAPDGVVTKEGRDLVMSGATSFFPPELINRLDTIQVFNKLTHQSILSIVSLRLGDVREWLKERRITLDVDDGAREWLARHGYSEEYGARAIARIIKTTVLNPLARKMLTGTIRDGDVVPIRVSSDGLTLSLADLHEPDAKKATTPSVPTHHNPAEEHY